MLLVLMVLLLVQLPTLRPVWSRVRVWGQRLTRFRRRARAPVWARERQQLVWIQGQELPLEPLSVHSWAQMLSGSDLNRHSIRLNMKTSRTASKSAHLEQPQSMGCH